MYTLVQETVGPSAAQYILSSKPSLVFADVLWACLTVAACGMVSVRSILPSVLGTWMLVVASASLWVLRQCFFSKGAEVVVILEDMGLQISSYSAVGFLKRSRFIPLASLQSCFINEGIHLFAVRHYLTLGVRSPRSGTDLVLLLDLHPPCPLGYLRQVRSGILALMAKAPS
ncbi:uncharacterized protein BJ171DRAFT_490083 [Polychytrium aggregatum]|uniref:uncharacterized protein n=1 Tax=Polychytrium aggregatum TaxID=110093 RepID=UPI0022FE6052|nr:uncharacterized protein BJ171DRAFT_522957 [Polychytrium aggregatum]XP_052970131.1 uncharacterized protein BJ171DRAFT_490083 [Polychytrium aggregatum]KAI9197041.1 hypothetical protein BJ171DRAFT_522957 [Polychytrium aggregatum]KAI9208051.1 hypothetical protein BJ171DRAFT_490083 [Polychytrium aggregatum]